MKEFLLVFRRDVVTKENQLSPEQMQASMKYWQDWMGGIAAQNKLVNSGSRLAADGKVIRPNNTVTDGPYAETKEAIGGYIIVRAESIKEASELSKGCPILNVGGNVEIRQLIAMEENN